MSLAPRDVPGSPAATAVSALYTPDPRRRATMRTAAGIRLHLVDPAPSEIDWRDVAAGLGRQTRFNGHTDVVFYSVAEHSIRGARHIDEPTAWDAEDAALLAGDAAHVVLCRRAFLLHDGHESYCGDWTTPVKRALDEIDPSGAASAVLKRLEDGVAAAIHRRAGLPWPLPLRVAQAVKRIDQRMYATERRDIAALSPGEDRPTLPPLPRTIRRPMNPGQAETAMIEALEAEGWMR